MDEIHQLRMGDSWEPMLRRGVILWRLAGFFGSVRGSRPEVTVDDFTWLKTEKGSYMARCGFGPTGLWEPEIYPAVSQHGQNNGGLAVFVKECPPKDWTHLVVGGLSLSLRQPELASKGGCVFADCCRPFEWNDYLDWRKQMFTIQTENLDCDMREAVEWSNQNWIKGTQPNHKRCIVRRWRYLDENIRFEYRVVDAPVTLADREAKIL